MVDWFLFLWRRFLRMAENGKRAALYCEYVRNEGDTLK